MKNKFKRKIRIAYACLFSYLMLLINVTHKLYKATNIVAIFVKFALYLNRLKYDRYKI